MLAHNLATENPVVLFSLVQDSRTEKVINLKFTEMNPCLGAQVYRWHEARSGPPTPARTDLNVESERSRQVFMLTIIDC